MAQRTDSIERQEPFNPLDKRNIGESIVNAMLAKALEPLPPAPFIGAGVYAIYYSGPHPAYAQLIAGCPIYVGKAVPAGARKGNVGVDPDQGCALHNRLKEHAESIASTDTLEVADFACRHLAVDDIWIPLAETLLIERFQPLWNVLIDGFGNHDPGKGRKGQQRSKWDTLHPGRTWAARLKPNGMAPQAIAEDIADFLARHHQ